MTEQQSQPGTQPGAATASTPDDDPRRPSVVSPVPLGVVGIVVVAIALVYLVGQRSTDLVTQSVVTGLLLGGVYALVSVGLTLIFGVLGIVNFAQGAMLTLAMYLVYEMTSSGGLPVYVATLLAVPIMFGFGVLVQTALLNKLTLAGSHEGPLLVTLGLSLLIINVLLMVFGGRPLQVSGSVEGSLDLLGAVASYERLIAFVGAIAVAAALLLLLRKTSFGMSIRAVSANAEGASLVGVDVRRIYALTFGIGAACVAVAGGLMSPFLSLTPTVGEQFTILAFVIVVLGGLGSVTGAVLGGLVIGLVQTVGALYFPGTGSLILVFAVFVLVLFFRPQGILGGSQ